MDLTKELERTYTIEEVKKEASRCLSCVNAPCMNDCPANTSPREFIRKVKEDDYSTGVTIITLNNAFGATCARTCPSEKYCEKNCTRGKIDQVINIRKIQRFLMDYAREQKAISPQNAQKNGQSVVIIGGGPAGLTAAKELLLNGYDVTILEKENALGGALRYGIPIFRLPEATLNQDIDKIISLGLKTEFNQELGKDYTVSDLAQKYDHVIVAIGRAISNNFDFLTNSPYVKSGVDFLKDAKLHPDTIKVPKKAVVLGGSDVAMDCCITLKLMGCEEVIDIYRRERARLRASKESLEHAEKCIDNFIFENKPIAIDGQKMKFNNYYDESKEMTVSADLFLIAIGQSVDESLLGDFIIENGEVISSKLPNVYAIGDVAKGDKTVVEAVKLGKAVAKKIIG